MPKINALIHSFMHPQYPPLARAYALCRARRFVNGCVSDALLQCCAKRVLT